MSAQVQLKEDEKESKQVTIFDKFYTQLDQKESEFRAILPKNISYNKFISGIKYAVIKNNTLITKHEVRESLMKACLDCAADGLMPDNREAALVMYYSKKDKKYNVSYIPMITGVINKSSDLVLDIQTNVICKNDVFDYQLGDNCFIVHKPSLESRGDVIGAYAIIKTKNGGIYREIMNKEEINKIKNSASYDFVWNGHFEEMAKKTVLKRCFKKVPKVSDELQKILDRDNYFEDLKQNAINIDSNNQKPASKNLASAFETMTDMETGEIIEAQVNEIAQLMHK